MTNVLKLILQGLFKNVSYKALKAFKMPSATIVNRIWNPLNGGSLLRSQPLRLAKPS